MSYGFNYEPPWGLFVGSRRLLIKLKMEKKEIIKPVEGYLVIKPDTIEKTDSGIYLSKDVSKNLTQTGKVISVGEEAPCKVGDTVVYQEWSGKEYKDHIILKFEDIMAVIEYV